MITEHIARVCHEANRAYCQAIGDETQVPWDDATPDQRNSCMNGVRFLQEHPEAGPAATHQEWVKYKLDEGWKWGPHKNETLREHPCLVPFVELPDTQQAKDHIFHAIVRTMTAI